MRSFSNRNLTFETIFVVEYFRYFYDGMTIINRSNITILTNESEKASSFIHIILLAMAMFSLSFITVLGNTIVIYALRTNRHLRTVI